MFTSDLKKIIPFNKRILLSSPTMHGNEREYVQEAFDSGWVTTVGEHISSLETELSRYLGVEEVVGLSSGTAALHLAIRLAASRLYTPDPLKPALLNKKVFVSNLTFSASVNPIVYEGGEPVFVDSSPIDWNMDPEALEAAFQIFPETKLVVVVNLYGTPGRIDELRDICIAHNALLIEDAAESLGAKYKCSEKGREVQTDSQSDISVVSFNGNKIITGSCGGAVAVHNKDDANRIRKWSTQSREAAPWYQHEEIGYNYRMSNIVAGVIRGQLVHLEEHINRKHEIYERYKRGFANLPVQLNPVPENCSPNYWLSCITVNSDAMTSQVRSDREALYKSEHGRSCPAEILEVLGKHNIEGRSIWKPMHEQKLYGNHAYVTSSGLHRGDSNAYISMDAGVNCSSDIFNRGLCLPSDVKMSIEEQERVIEVVKRCFD